MSCALAIWTTFDWGHARDYVRAMWLIVATEQPDDYVISTGVLHSVRDLVRETFERLELRSKTMSPPIRPFTGQQTHPARR